MAKVVKVIREGDLVAKEERVVPIRRIVDVESSDHDL